MIEKNDLCFARNIYIKPEEAQLFKVAWENLMLDFRIPQQHQAPLFEIMENFFLRIDHHSLFIYELNCSIQAIDFFIAYFEKFNASLKDKQPTEIDEFAKVRFEITGIETEFKYPNSSQTTINALYEYLKKHDNFLHSHFCDFEGLPSIDDLHLIKERLGGKNNDKMQCYVIEQIEDLKKFISTNLAKELSRKVNYFIFESLYLFNIIRHAGKVGGRDSEDFALSDTTSNLKFTPLVIEPTAKSGFITKIIANAVKRETPDI